MHFPQRGRPADDVVADLQAMTADDKDFRRGRTFGLVYHAGEDLERIVATAHEQFLWHNALNPDAFPSLRRMQSEVVAMTADLLGAEVVAAEGGEVAGFMTSGGTESILMAVKAAKVRARRERDVEHPNVVLAASAHAAFDKACGYFGLESRRVPVRSDWRADIDAMAGAIDADTALIVGSAPQYPQGVIDPIPELAALAAERDINCHVDACMGGFVLPFLERLGRDIPPWNFAVPGVTSISADIHKYGYTPKGASVILHRSKELRRDQTFVFDGWLGGFYGSSGVLGTKPGGPIAAAWTAFQYLGIDGYCERVAKAVEARERLVAGVRGIAELAVVGEPEVTLAAITAADGSGFDVFALGTELFDRGWMLDRQGPPDSLHCSCAPVHADMIDEFLSELADAVRKVAGTRADDRSTNYAAME